MAKPKPPTGCRIKGGRYYRVRYIGQIEGRSRYQWHALSRVSDGLPALYAELEELVSNAMIIKCNLVGASASLPMKD